MSKTTKAESLAINKKIDYIMGLEAKILGERGDIYAPSHKKAIKNNPEPLTVTMSLDMYKWLCSEAGITAKGDKA